MLVGVPPARVTPLAAADRGVSLRERPSDQRFLPRIEQMKFEAKTMVVDVGS